MVIGGSVHCVSEIDTHKGLMLIGLTLRYKNIKYVVGGS